MKRYHDWYTQFGAGYARILRNNCTADYEDFLVFRPGTGCYSCYVTPLLNCLLDNVDEYTKAKMATASILLGLLPTLLAYFGSNLLNQVFYHESGKCWHF